MKIIVFISVLLMFCLFGEAQSSYYVSLDGDNSNYGLSETKSWRTIQFAVSASSPVTAGDTIHIKAGNYGNEQIVLEKNGTVSAPIVIAGYQASPMDNPNLNYVYGDKLDASIMPLIDGGDRTVGVGIDINSKSNVELRNIQITNYKYGAYTWSSASSNLTIDNIIVMNVGDINASYSGLGIGIIYANNNIVRNCVVVNSCAEGISIVADSNLIENCRVYCDEDMTVEASTDYYIVAEGNHNTFKNCYIERVGDLEHVGHGMGLKGNCENNLFLSCTAKDMEGGGFYVRHRGTKYNEFRNCKAIGRLNDVLGFLVRDGASYNEFNNCFSDSCTSGIRFLDTDEDDGAQYCGRHNVFNNCIVNNPISAIEFHSYSVASPVDSNLFSNCVFNGGINLFKSDRRNYENEMVNCIISNFQSLSIGAESLLFDYSFSDFYKNNFEVPVGAGMISDNPLFVNPVAGDFHVQSESPCIDAGSTNNAPTYDFDGNSRPLGARIDIGAFEYNVKLGITESKVLDFLIYPNPTFGTSFMTSSVLYLDYTVFSIAGEVLKEGNFKTNQIDLSEFNAGIYFIVVMDNPSGRTKTVKLMKK